jgi:hypothetical protein
MATERWLRIPRLVPLALVVVALTIASAEALDPPPVPTWAWDPAEPSAIVAYYEVELSVNEGPFQPVGVVEPPNLEFTLGDVAYIDKYAIRVRAVSTGGLVGPYSLVSEPYSVPLPAQPVPPGN